MREIEAVAGAVVAGGSDVLNTVPLFAVLVPEYEYLPVLPPLPLDGLAEA